MEKEIWKKINGELVNPNWVIADFYEVSNKGRIFNLKTGRILTSRNGKYLLHCKEFGHSYCAPAGDRAAFNIKNIMVATFENKSTFRKHIK